MKKQILLPIITLCFLLSGCLKEDMSGCDITDHGLLIHFVYTNEKNMDEFASRIDNVDLFIFDEGGYYLSTHNYNTRKLAEFQGAADLELEPGTYHMIAWGNVYGNDNLPELQEGNMIHTAKITYSETSVGGDSLYYAPRRSSGSANNLDFDLYEVVIPEKGRTEVTLDFMTTYYALNVYVKGFKDYIGNYNQTPYIQVSHLPESYNFHLNLGDYIKAFTRKSQTVNINGSDHAYTTFLARYIENQNPVQIHVIRSMNQEVAHTVNL